MKRVKHEVFFLEDTSEGVVAELVTITRLYPWWGYPWGWYSNGYEVTKETIYRQWYGSWIRENGELVSVKLWNWLNEMLRLDRAASY